MKTWRIESNAFHRSHDINETTWRSDWIVYYSGWTGASKGSPYMYGVAIGSTVVGWMSRLDSGHPVDGKQRRRRAFVREEIWDRHAAHIYSLISAYHYNNIRDSNVRMYTTVWCYRERHLPTIIQRRLLTTAPSSECRMANGWYRVSKHVVANYDDAAPSDRYYFLRVFWRDSNRGVCRVKRNILEVCGLYAYRRQHQ